MAYLQSMYSGSSGNCTVIRDKQKVILTDIGKSCRATITALNQNGVAASDVGAIVITHEHTDHISGLEVFLKHYPVPVFTSEKCIYSLLKKGSLKEKDDFTMMKSSQTLEIEGIAVTAFQTHHDSVDSFGYRFETTTGNKVAIVTDTGKICENIYSYLEGCDIVGIESNYDEGMLLMGGYPLSLKRRIKSEYGHLSNVDAAQTIVKLAKNYSSRFLLMHLSKDNNTPEAAEMTCCGMLENYDLYPEISVAKRDLAGERLEF